MSSPFPLLFQCILYNVNYHFSFPDLWAWLDKHNPAASWTHIYIDGSAENATRNGGCGAYIKRPGKPPFSVGTWWDTVLKLQSWSPSTAEYHRNYHSFHGKRSPRKQSTSQTHSQPCKSSCLVNLTQHKRSSKRTSAPSLRLPVLFFSGYQHTPAFEKMKQQISTQKKEEERSNSHHICPTEKSKLLSVIKRMPSSTARLEDTTQTRMHSISCHDTNRPPSFAQNRPLQTA